MDVSRYHAEKCLTPREGEVCAIVVRAHGRAPELGSYNDEALARLGYTPTQIADLRERKII